MDYEKKYNNALGLAQYIDKADIVAEIERLKGYAQTLGDNAINSSMQQFYDGMVECCNCLLNILNTLEVKEVDLEKEIYDYANNHFTKCGDGVLISDANSMELTMLDIIPLAKHFFELGIKAQKGGEE